MTLVIALGHVLDPKALKLNLVLNMHLRYFYYVVYLL